MNRGRIWRRLAYGVGIALLVWIWFQPKLEGSDNLEQQTILGEHWGITGERGSRTTKVSQCDGTNELIYFTYDSKPFVDVYDHSGAFLYTIMLPDARNGGVQIECREGLLIVSAKTNTVYLFRGTELVERMEHDEARERGLNPDQREEKSEYVLTPTHLARADGEVLFELPPEISGNLPLSVYLTKGQLRWAGILSLILFAAAWLTVVGSCVVKMWNGFREDRGKTEKNRRENWG